MRVRVRLFAGTREAVGSASLDLDVPEGARVDDALTLLCRAHPALARYRGHALYAVDGTFVPTSQALRAGAELAIMPPVSGGMGALQDGPFSIDALAQEIERTGAGAVVAFVGYVRGDEGIARLRFEAYAEMAEREIETLRGQAIAKFSLTGCVIRHRIAVIAVGEPIVAVVTAAPHRKDAFDAASWIMDELKTRVPIWKSEEGARGSAWVNDPTR